MASFFFFEDGMLLKTIKISLSNVLWYLCIITSKQIRPWWVASITLNITGRQHRRMKDGAVFFLYKAVKQSVALTVEV